MQIWLKALRFVGTVCIFYSVPVAEGGPEAQWSARPQGSVLVTAVSL